MSAYEKNDRQLTFRATKSFQDRLKQAAASARVPPSVFARNAIEDAVIAEIGDAGEGKRDDYLTPECYADLWKDGGIMLLAEDYLADVHKSIPSRGRRDVQGAAISN